MLTTFFLFYNLTFCGNTCVHNSHQLGAKGDVKLVRGADGSLIIPKKVRVGSQPVDNYITGVIQKRKPSWNDHTAETQVC